MIQACQETTCAIIPLHPPCITGLWVQHNEQDGSQTCHLAARGLAGLGHRGCIVQPLDHIRQRPVHALPAHSSACLLPLQLSIQLARVITQVQDFNSIPEQLLMLLAARQDLSPVQQRYNDTKQPLEWVLRQVE